MDASEHPSGDEKESDDLMFDWLKFNLEDAGMEGTYILFAETIAGGQKYVATVQPMNGMHRLEVGLGDFHEGQFRPAEGCARVAGNVGSQDCALDLAERALRGDTEFWEKHLCETVEVLNAYHQMVSDTETRLAEMESAYVSLARAESAREEAKTRPWRLDSSPGSIHEGPEGTW